MLLVQMLQRPSLQQTTRDSVSQVKAKLKRQELLSHRAQKEEALSAKRVLEESVRIR